MSFHNEKVGYVQGATVNFLEGKRCKWVEAAETVLAVEIDGWLRLKPWDILLGKWLLSHL